METITVGQALSELDTSSKGRRAAVITALIDELSMASLSAFGVVRLHTGALKDGSEKVALENEFLVTAVRQECDPRNQIFRDVEDKAPLSLNTPLKID